MVFSNHRIEMMELLYFLSWNHLRSWRVCRQWRGSTSDSSEIGERKGIGKCRWRGARRKTDLKAEGWGALFFLFLQSSVFVHLRWVVPCAVAISHTLSIQPNSSCAFPPSFFLSSSCFIYLFSISLSFVLKHFSHLFFLLLSISISQLMINVASYPLWFHILYPGNIWMFGKREARFSFFMWSLSFRKVSIL